MTSVAALRQARASDGGGAEEHCGRGRGSAPELMMAALEQGREGAILLQNLASGGLERLMQEKAHQRAALGPGLSTRASERVCAGVCGEVKLPMVVDADALNAFAGALRN